MVFPYPTYYPNQREIIGFVSQAAAAGKNPVLESPTGSGKTVAVLSALLPVAREKGKRILYLCRTHEQMSRVIEELKRISEREPALGLSLMSRKALCLNEFVREKTRTPGEERFACSVLRREGKCEYHRNAGRARFTFTSPMSAGEIAARCRTVEACPYEVARTLLPSCEVVSCSYLYVFVPEIRSALLRSMELQLNDVILVLDEAHNLPRLAASIAGERLTEFAVTAALREAREHGLKQGGKLLQRLQEFMAANEAEERRIEKEALIKHLEVEPDLLEPLERAGDEIRREKVIAGRRPVSFLHACASFLAYWMECREEEFAFFSSKTTKGLRCLEILPLEPRLITQEPLQQAYLSLHMSGTLTPIQPYCKVIGLEGYVERSFPPPFPEENIIALVDPSVTTLGSLRTREMYRRISRRLESLLPLIPGNVLVFFPSYVVLSSVLNEGVEVEKKLFVEREEMSSVENREMVERFKRAGNAVLMGVQQGRNSEGQDFPGEQARAVIVVGIPYAVKGPKVNAQIEYYRRMYPGVWGSRSLGEYYAYYLPAYRALNQSAGRAHRSIEDKAAIVFLERRVAFDRKVLENISPWIRRAMRRPGNVETELKRFYSSS